MGENTATQVVKGPRLTRSRLLVGFVGLCLLLWGINAIHHAMLPKYRGKTMAEWFNEIRCDVDRKTGYFVLVNDPAAQAFNHFGESGIVYLASQIQPDVSTFSAELVSNIRILTKNRVRIDSAEIRNIKASEALRQLGTNALPAVPYLLQLAKASNDPGSNIVMKLVYELAPAQRNRAP